MRIHRLRLRNWRGVVDREVRFSDVGVTVVEGPNETGKSSLLEALDFLLDEPDSTLKSKVKAAKPVHRDEGPEVEADLTAGPYDLTYRKRFVRRPEAVLTIRAPRPESLTGREAHDRVREILAETTDLDLWKALRIDQGQGLVPAQLGSGRWLGVALERAAGGTEVGDLEQTLLVASEQEFLRWWTPSGKDGRELTDPAARAAGLGAEVERLREDLRRVESDVARVADLVRERARLAISAADLRRRATEHDVAFRGIQATRVRKAERERARMEVKAALDVAVIAADDRARLVERAKVAVDAVEALDASLAGASPDLKEADETLEAAQQAVTAAKAEAARAADLASLRERDFEFRRDELDLEQLRERLARVVTAESTAEAATKVLSENRVDESTLKSIRGAREAFVAAQAAADAAQTTVRIEAKTALDLRVDGAPAPLAAGEHREVPVAGRTSIELPGIAAIEVVAGAGASVPRRTLDERRDRLRDACAEAGVKDHEDAERAHAARNEARRAVGARDERVKENLRDLTRDAMPRMIAGLAARVAVRSLERASDLPIAIDFGEARRLATDARGAATAAAASLAEAEKKRDAARDRRDKATTAMRHSEGRLGVLREQARAGAQALATAREGVSDDDLVARRESAKLVLATAEEAVRVVEKELRDAGADAIETLATNAREAADRAASALRAVEDEHTKLEAALAATGESGVGERLGAKEAELARAQRDLDGRRSRAAAAKLLFETLVAARDEARARYVAPLRERIEQYGKVVFGPTLRVEVGDDLSLVSRTIDDRTVPFDSLSGGAKEQLGLVARLACAAIVEEQGGLPIVFDDALGSSDPQRLELVSALLSVAGRRSQVVVLTCFPDRYRHVGGATVVRFAPGA